MTTRWILSLTLLLFVGPVGCGKAPIEQSAAIPAAQISAQVVEPRTLGVVLAYDDRYPEADDTFVMSALELAQQWIQEYHDTSVKFEIVRRTPIDQYQAEQLQGMTIPEEWWGFWYGFGNDNVDRFRAGFLAKAPSGNWSPSELEALLPDAKISSTDHRANVDAVLAEARTHLESLESIQLVDGMGLVDPENAARNSFSAWLCVLRAVRLGQVRDHLVITNTFLFDDAYADGTPHSLIRGGVLNGFCLPDGNQSVVTYFPLITSLKEIAAIRGELTDSDKVRALAHIIAHEVGTHGIQLWNDVYDHEGCLARPTRGLNYLETLAQLEKEKCTAPHETLDILSEIGRRYGVMASMKHTANDFDGALEAVNEGLKHAPRHVGLLDYQQYLMSMDESSR